MKKLLLASSLVTLLFLVASGLSENVFVSWKGYQKEYARRFAERVTDIEAKRTAGGAPAETVRIEVPGIGKVGPFGFEPPEAVELRQIVVPDLAVFDRCVSCHLGMDNPVMAGSPNPYRPHPGKILAIHPPERFGCTVCHRGQGAAVNFREAKGVDADWDYPMLPKELSESSCGICHDPKSLGTSGAPVLALGARLFEEKGCHGCHRLGGLGGSLGAQLDSVGRKTRGQLIMAKVPGERTTYRWLDLHFKDPQGIVAGSLMKPDYPTEEEARALTVYMLSLQSGRELPDRVVARDRHRLLAVGHDSGELDGRALYDRLCRVCHGEGTIGGFDKHLGRFVPAIRNPAFLGTADRRFLRANILRGRPGTLMAGFEGGLPKADLEALLGFLAGRTGLPENRTAMRVAVPRGDAGRGSGIFSRQCAGCHDPGEKGQVAPTLSSRTFQENAGDRMILDTIARGRPGTAMVAFAPPGGGGFTEEDLRDLLAHIRSLASRRK